MILDFPRSCAFLERTKLSYINLAALLSDAKRDRTGRVAGYLNISFGETCYLVFLRNGEPFYSGALDRGARRAVPLAAVLHFVATEIEHGEGGTIGFYGAPEAQLLAMVATFETPPPPILTELESSDPDRLFPALRANAFSGFVELESAGQIHYLHFEKGMYRAGFFVGRGEGAAAGEFIRALFTASGSHVAVRLYSPLVELPVQAPPALVELYRTLLWNTARDVAPHLGGADAATLLEVARLAACGRLPLLDQLRVDPQIGIVGELVASAEALTDAVAAWLTEFLAQATDRAAIDPVEVLQRQAHDGRFVLAEHGFFNRLPWPVGV
jgi:hypothetical protein